ncbi:hypothetical protein KSF_112100 [Reticulibacter mediterranei]|uniref:Uncharacterized protein n=1 Tax=Reticulibacter mediterranei TaxID=2778369 RepID=A0A8J3NB68_9CHLR|nr:hypothetical protein [Reticulibacter mediterranei]GHP01163.1 hypothetical protein KSF_112100 [Reticulibacter mediterranei]
MDITMMLQLLSQLRSFRLRENWNRKLLEDYQTHALRLLRAYAYAHSPFYQRFHQGLYNAWQPEMLIAYASMARVLADEQLSGHLRITPRVVFPSSEVLTEETRRRMEQAWGERIFNQYAATECGSLAAECDQHQGMHLSEDLVIFEVVDSGNRPVPPGVYGDKLLITVLGSRTQPLIRYELSDIVSRPVSAPVGDPLDSSMLSGDV